MSKFNLDEYVSLLNRIKENYDNFKSDITSEEYYYTLRDSLLELRELLDNRVLPVELVVKTEKMYLSCYRRMEGTYIGKRTRGK